MVRGRREGRLALLEAPDTELVLGVVAAVGTDLDLFRSILRDYLKQYRYETTEIRVTELFRRLDVGRIDHADECRQIELRMDAGNKLRRRYGRGDALARFAADAIARERESKVPARPARRGVRADELEHACFARRAYLIRSLKHVDEVTALRRIYGNAFYLIGLYSTEAERRKTLVERKNCEPEHVDRLIRRDQDEDKPLGQQTRDTFALADVFVQVRSDDTKRVEDQISRFLDLLFAKPHVQPTRDEHAMHLAFATSLRSADLSRQVGAVITNRRGDIVATGANDVPRQGGGPYWLEDPDVADQRDYRLGHDENHRRRDELIVKVMQEITELRGRLTPARRRKLLERGKEILRDTGIRDLIEFSRAVHAEADALLACARNGITIDGGTLYCTTFPCHLCAKLVVDAGIVRVVYIEPYPKSLAKELHGDSIAVEADDPAGRVRFEPFIGIGPRHFPLLFAMNLGNGYPVRRKDGEGNLARWERRLASLRVPNLPLSYPRREQFAFSGLKPLARK